ncbi:MAG: hypothetical protein QGI73_01125 [Candidatus Thalassarchaeaceae archaeon]|nr:hypothetical protein [Candidatus Thalassarchaeaceae archaeon]
MTGELAAIVTYALLSTILGCYSFNRISILINLKSQISARIVQDVGE